MPSIAFGFDAENKAAQRAAARQAATLVTNVSTETKLAIRQLITRAIKDGIPPYDAGRLIEGMVGLNRRQMEAAYNLRIRLIDSGLPIDKVDSRVARYQAKALKQRGRMIARTEIMNSLANGTEESWMQAQAQGKIGANAKKEWIITPIDACNICRSIDGQQVALQAPFMSIKGTIQNPTAHPNCRCAIVVVPGTVAQTATPLTGGTTPQPRPTPKPRPRPKRRVRRQAPKAQATQSTRALNIVGDDADDALMNNAVKSQDELMADNTSKTVIIEGDDFKAVFKPEEGAGWELGDSLLRDSVSNKKFALAEREVLAETIDRKLGTNMVPTTRMRDVPGQGKGSAQRFVKDSKAAIDIGDEDWGHFVLQHGDQDDLWGQFVLDLAIGNTDRHTGNFMIIRAGKHKGRIVAIDHGLTFPAQTRLTRSDFYTGKDIELIDRLGLDAFRNETFDVIKASSRRNMSDSMRKKLIANIDATDWKALAETTNMNKLELNAFTERMKWLRARLEADDLFETLDGIYDSMWGFKDIEDIPGIVQLS